MIHADMQTSTVLCICLIINIVSNKTFYSASRVFVEYPNLQTEIELTVHWTENTRFFFFFLQNANLQIPQTP
jgi:hypothetical protein